MGANQQGAAAIEGRWLTICRTLCFILNGGDILLMKRSATRRVFPNRYNGVGGHIERGEDALTSLRREVAEETNLTVHSERLRAVYNIDAGDSTGITLFVFTAVSDSRDFVANVEGTLHWVPRGEVMSLDLVEDLPYLLPRVLEMHDHAAPLFVHVSYDEQDQIRMRFAE